MIYITVSGTPGFAVEHQLGLRGETESFYILNLCCEWRTFWSLKYRPIDERQRQEIDKIIQVS